MHPAPLLPLRRLHHLLACALAVLPLAALPAHAGELAGLSIINQDTGEPLQIWRHAGRNYIVGEPNQRYALNIKNKTRGRLLAVAAVDGINVISGATASSQQPGYVLSAWQDLDIAGWRKSTQDVAAFYFTRLPDSYAARTGRGQQVGVIGVALYRESVAPPVMIAPEASRSGEAQPYPAPPAASNDGTRQGGQRAIRERQMPSAESKIGTGHGERVHSPSHSTDFRRSTTYPAETLTVYYDTYRNLVARGVIPRYHRRHHDEPAAFPGDGPFVPDPR